MVVNPKQTIMAVNSSQNSHSSTIVSSLIFAGFHTGSPVLTMPKKKKKKIGLLEYAYIRHSVISKLKMITRF